MEEEEEKKKKMKMMAMKKKYEKPEEPNAFTQMLVASWLANAKRTRIRKKKSKTHWHPGTQNVMCFNIH